MLAGCRHLEVDEGEDCRLALWHLPNAWRDALHSMKGLPNVIDLRNLGQVGAMELSSSKEADAAPEGKAHWRGVKNLTSGSLPRMAVAEYSYDSYMYAAHAAKRSEAEPGSTRLFLKNASFSHSDSRWDNPCIALASNPTNILFRLSSAPSRCRRRIYFRRAAMRSSNFLAWQSWFR